MLLLAPRVAIGVSGGLHEEQCQTGGRLNNVGNSCNIQVAAGPAFSHGTSSGRNPDNRKPPGDPPKTKVFHVIGGHPDSCIIGVGVGTYDCPSSRMLAHGSNDILVSLNEETLRKSGFSNALLVRGSLLAGCRGPCPSRVMRDMVGH